MYTILMASVWTIVILFIGAVVGYIVGSKKLDSMIEDFKSKSNHPPIGSGPLKPPTPQELSYKNNKTVIDRQKELMS